jgi:hypothetical protein
MGNARDKLPRRHNWHQIGPLLLSVTGLLRMSDYCGFQAYDGTRGKALELIGLL